MGVKVKTESSIDVPTYSEFTDLDARVAALEGSGGSSWSVFRNDNDAPRVNTLSVETVWTIIGYQRINDVKSGDIIHVGGEIQVSNDLSYNIGWTTYLAWLAGPDDGWSTTRSDWNLIYGTRNGQNVSPSQHHDRVGKYGTLTYSGTTYPKFWLCVWGKAYSTASQSGDTISIDRFGLHVTHFRSPL